MPRDVRAFLFAFLLLSASLLTGCNQQSSSSWVAHTPVAGTALHGSVFGGQQPVSDSTIQLYAATANGVGTASTSLITATVTTSDGTGLANSNANAGNANNSLPTGFFTISGDYTCPTADTPVYLVASGGNPGLSSGTNNTALQEMVSLGSCGLLNSSTSISLNEVTTVGSVAALYPYMTAYNALGAQSGELNALLDKANVATEYMNFASGTAPGPNLPSGYYASSTEINTLADIIAACVNSTGNTGSSSICGMLFTVATPQGGAAPTDTIGALIDILNNPTNNVTAIFNLQSSSPPFQPVLSTAPANWTLPILPIPSAPYYSPAAGTYAAAQSVTIASQTAGVSIYYTTNGSTPTTSSSLYSSAVSVSANSTLKAIAVNRVSGPASSASYTITGTPGAPVFSLAGGTYTSPQIVSITSATPDAAIYYTTNGSTPSSASALYTGALEVSGTETLQAVAISGSTPSTVSSASYTVTRTSGTIFTFAGGGSVGSGIPATSASLNGPAGVALDNSGNLYFADVYNYRVRKIALATGVITTVAGNGTLGYTGDGGPATSAELSAPAGIAVDSNGNVFVSDSTLHCVRKITASTGNIATVAGTCGTSGSTGDGGAATAALLYKPNGLAVDPSGDVFIADTNNNAIREVSASTGNIATVAGIITSGASGGYGDGGLATSAKLYYPQGIAVDAAGNLFIADTTNYRVRRVSAATGIINTFAGNGTSTYSTSQEGAAATSAGLNYPKSVWVDENGNVFIAEANGNRVREVSAATGNITTVAGTGTGTYNVSQEGGPATSVNISSPTGVVVDPSGNLYLCDTGNNRIRFVNAATGNLNTIAGTNATGYGSILNGVAAPNSSFGSLGTPQGIVVDASGNVYFAVSGLYRVFKVAAGTGVLTTVAGTGFQTSSTAPLGDGGPATSATLNNPYSVAVDSSGNVYIADTNNQRIRKVNASTGIITTVAGNGTGASGAIGDGGAATSAELDYPYGIALDGSGNLYIADTNNQRIRMISASTGNINTVVGTGTAGYVASQDGGLATAAELNYPYGITVDSSGNLYISDSSNQRIRKVTASTGIISTIAGTGTGGYVASQDGGLATAAELYLPRNTAVDAAGNVYIADRNNYRVRKITASSGVITTVAGSGSGTYTTAQEGIAATSATLNFPFGVAVDANGVLYITDTSNDRVRVVYP